MRVRAVVAYDGTDYSGFQRQANAPTIQATLEAGLAQVTQEETTILAAGRTDAGVHAVGQVIAFDTAWRHELSDLRRALNAVLPADVVVLEVQQAAPDFHPRYAARSRRYRYTLYNAPIRSPLARRYSLHVAEPLDVEAMQQAAQMLVGEHDFAAFGQPMQDETTVRRVLAAGWRKEPLADFVCFPGDQTGAWLIFDIEANAFLYRMVRSLVGTMLMVGRGEMSVDEFADTLASRQRERAGPTVPPHGLCLIQVVY